MVTGGSSGAKGREGQGHGGQPPAVKFVDVTLCDAVTRVHLVSNMTLSIEPQDKLAIVGRAGSGKSRLALILAGLDKLTAGAVLFNGVDLALQCDGYEEVNPHVAFLTRDHCLLNGTIRSNMDPDGQHTNVRLWQALRKCGLDEFVQNLEHRLDAQVLPGGANLRPLHRASLCLARASLVGAKVIVLNQFTANLGVSPDAAKLEALAHSVFVDCTVVSITSRLDFVRKHYSKVVCMDQGMAQEVGDPEELYRSESSAFRALWERTTLQQ